MIKRGGGWLLGRWVLIGIKDKSLRIRCGDSLKEEGTTNLTNLANGRGRDGGELGVWRVFGSNHFLGFA